MKQIFHTPKSSLYFILVVCILLGGMAVAWKMQNLTVSLFTVGIGLAIILLLLLINKNSTSPATDSKLSDQSIHHEELTNALNSVKEVKQQLVLQEKMASIGILAAGIAHEIKNPLNFINNFSDITVELVDDLKKELTEPLANAPEETKKSIQAILEDIESNCSKINEHGKRAESIIKNMLIQSRTSEVEKSPVDINALLEEFINLSYHGMRAQNNKFNVKIEKNIDKNIQPIVINQQSIGRVILNIMNNGLYAANEKALQINGDFMPTISIGTEQNDQHVIIKIKDNGNGIPENLRRKIFEPFFTTKPAGEGTGLGLPLCYDIVVKEHGGNINVLSTPGEFTEFIIQLPKK